MFPDLVERIDRAVQGHLGGVTVTYATASGDPVEVEGMFDENYLLISPGETAVESGVPALFLRLEDLPELPEDDDPEITIDGKVYRVRERQTDGSAGGGVLLLLHRAD
jgi:hypothetical protein